MSERFCYLSSWTCSEKINVGKWEEQGDEMKMTLYKIECFCI